MGNQQVTSAQFQATTVSPPRPRTEYGVVDWEQFFEHVTDGLVPLVRQARSRDALKKCSMVIVEGLFTRKDDHIHRQTFLRAIGDIVGETGDIEETKDRLIDLLRQLKEHRAERAAEFIRGKRAEEAAAPERRRPGPPPEIALVAGPSDNVLEFDTLGQTSTQPDQPGTTTVPAELFCLVFWEIIAERLEMLRRGLTRSPLLPSPLPYLFSKDFADRYQRIVVADIAPDLAQRLSTIIRPAELLPPEQRHQFLREQIDEHKNRRSIWALWQEVWIASTRQAELPAEPKEQKKGKLDFLKKKEDVPAWRKTMTREEWQEAVARTTAANQRAQRIWAEITAPADVFSPPHEEDNGFLMELFAHSPQVLQQNIQAIRQIGQQGGEVGRTFDSYRRNKNMDLPVLASCLWFPDIFLEGKKTLLKSLVSGILKQDLPRYMPLTCRYLEKFL
ncbi:MAG: hypothetical protein H7841_05910 [Magnetospirillum sp. WYHS-4]